MTSKQAVLACIEFKNPDFLPVLYFNRDKEQTDALILDYAPPFGFVPSECGEDEWGVVWQNHSDGTMGQPKSCPLENGYEYLEEYKFPNAYAAGRFDYVSELAKQNSDKFLIGGFHLSGFAIVAALRGFENAMTDLYCQRDDLETLLCKIADFEIEIARQYAQIGADAIAFYDDWGTQNTLMINPEIWREIFKPVYKRQFEAVHKMGCKVYFHCCGNIKLIIDDLIEIGADVLNLNQPDIFPVSYLEENYRGKICFNCPVDHQTIAIFGTDKEINDYVDALCEKLGTENGGFFGYIEEYKSVGMSEENYQSIRAAFARQRFVCYSKKD